MCVCDCALVAVSVSSPQARVFFVVVPPSVVRPHFAPQAAAASAAAYVPCDRVRAMHRRCRRRCCCCWPQPISSASSCHRTHRGSCLPLQRNAVCAARSDSSPTDTDTSVDAAWAWAGAVCRGPPPLCASYVLQDASPWLSVLSGLPLMRMWSRRAHAPCPHTRGTAPCARCTCAPACNACMPRACGPVCCVRAGVCVRAWRGVAWRGHDPTRRGARRRVGRARVCDTVTCSGTVSVVLVVLTKARALTKQEISMI